MSRGVAIAKLVKAAQLSAQAAKLYAEASEELAADAVPSPEGITAVSEVDQARARKMLKKAGARIA
jgi:hypothetical protein